MEEKVIVFDFGGVLVDWNPRHLYKSVFAEPTQMEYFLTYICSEDWNLEQDRGRTLAEGTKILQAQFPKYHDLIHLFYSQWETMLHSDIPASVEMLHKLKKQYKVYGLTNWSAETFPIALRRFDFFKLFDGIVVSGDEKMIKPDKRFFQILLDRYNLKAENCIFIDDNIKNIVSAGEMGFICIHFTTETNLELELAKLGVM